VHHVVSVEHASPAFYGPPPGSSHAYAYAGPPPQQQQLPVATLVERRLVGTRLKAEGWCCVFALALLFWPAMCIPCCLPQCQEDVYEDIYIMARPALSMRASLLCPFFCAAGAHRSLTRASVLRSSCAAAWRAADAGHGATRAGLSRAAPAAVNETVMGVVHARVDARTKNEARQRSALGS
jgi:hypothetical protein